MSVKYSIAFSLGILHICTSLSLPCLRFTYKLSFNPKNSETYFDDKLSLCNVEHKNISLGRFNWQKEQQVKLTLKNTGDNLLMIENVSTSCGCTSVSYSKEPVRSGNSVSLNVSYKADHPEHFNKTITVYCNAESSPILLRIAGDAE